MTENDKTLFVTGGSGFIGSNFLIDASKNGYSFYVLTRDRKKIEAMGINSVIEIIEGDLSEISKFIPQLKKCKYFIHIAGEKSDESKMHSVNVDSLREILNVIAGLSDIRLMQISSCGVYGINVHPNEILSENMQCFPMTFYEKTKLEAENLITEFAKKHPVKYVILRPSNVFGVRDKPYNLLNLIKSMNAGRFFLIDKKSSVNYVSVKYVTDVMIQLLKLDHFTNEIYNVNSPVKLKDFVRHIKMELGVAGRTKYIPSTIVYPLALVFEMLPVRMQLMNRLKYYALKNRRIYSSDKLDNIINSKGNDMLYQEIKNLISFYKKKKLL